MARGKRLLPSRLTSAVPTPVPVAESMNYDLQVDDDVVARAEGKAVEGWRCLPDERISLDQILLSWVSVEAERMSCRGPRWSSRPRRAALPIGR